MNEYELNAAMKLGTKNEWEEHPYSPDSKFNTEYYTNLDISKSRRSKVFRHAVVIKLSDSWGHVAHIVLKNPDTVNIEGKDWLKLGFGFYSKDYRKWKSDVVFMDPLLYMRIMIKHNIHSK